MFPQDSILGPFFYQHSPPGGDFTQCHNFNRHLYSHGSQISSVQTSLLSASLTYPGFHTDTSNLTFPKGTLDFAQTLSSSIFSISVNATTVYPTPPVRHPRLSFETIPFSYICGFLPPNIYWPLHITTTWATLVHCKTGSASTPAHLLPFFTPEWTFKI